MYIRDIRLNKIRIINNRDTNQRTNQRTKTNEETKKRKKKKKGYLPQRVSRNAITQRYKIQTEERHKDIRSRCYDTYQQFINSL